MKKTFLAFGAIAALFLVSGVSADIAYYNPTATQGYYNTQGWGTTPWLSNSQGSMLHSYPGATYPAYGNSAYHYNDGLETALYGYDYNTCRGGRCTEQTPYFDYGYNYGTALLNQYQPQQYTPTYTTPSYTRNYDYSISNSHNIVRSYNTDNSVSSYNYNYGGCCCSYGHCYC